MANVFTRLLPRHPVVAATLGVCLVAGCAAQQPKQRHEWTDLKGEKHYDMVDATATEPSGWETAGKVVGYTLAAPFIVAGFVVFDVALPVAEARMSGGNSHSNRDALADQQQQQANFEQQQANQAAQMERDLQIQRQYNAARTGR